MSNQTTGNTAESASETKRVEIPYAIGSYFLNAEDQQLLLRSLLTTANLSLSANHDVCADDADKIAFVLSFALGIIESPAPAAA